MAEHETIANIIAEKRRLAEYMRKNLSTVHVRRLDEEAEIRFLEGEADRLEAAMKRERGDCAKLREAVIGLRDRISMFYKNEWIPYDEWEGANDDANSALTAPSRNCDRPECATTKAAQDVWRKEDGGKTAYYEWLLATYKKGGNNGK